MVFLCEATRGSEQCRFVPRPCRHTWRHATAGVAALCIACAISACAGSSSSAVVRVGDISIDRVAVDHWATAISLGAAGTISPERPYGSPREMALNFLISADWLIGEATERGLEVSSRAIDQALAERIDSMSGGRAELLRRLARMHQTIADVRLEIKVILAASLLREAMSRSLPVLTRQDVAAYYDTHRSSFRAPDERVVDLIENISSARAARALGRRLGAGLRFAKRAQRESVLRQSAYEAAHRPNGKLVHAIFAATPGTVSGPVAFNGLWVILVVRRLVRGAPMPLESAAEAIAKLLLVQRRGRVEPRFLASYRMRWKARTSCRPGFVVEKCAQHAGPPAREVDPLRASERPLELVQLLAR